MAGAAKDALLDHPGVRSHFQHVEVVIGFKDQAVRAAKMYFCKRRHVAEIRDDGELRAVGAKGERDGVGSVVGDGESVHVNVADGEVLSRVNLFDATKAFSKSSG